MKSSALGHAVTTVDLMIDKMTGIIDPQKKIDFAKNILMNALTLGLSFLTVSCSSSIVLGDITDVGCS